MKYYCYLLLFITTFAQADQDADFLAARDAFRAGDAVKLQHFAQRYKNRRWKYMSAITSYALTWTALRLIPLKHFLAALKIVRS